ncbi:RuBisCO large subunit C-terminal-like domain-containing protein [Balneolaceae bacterium ANBcel3]|nr:RuBisCO large subunit C-terminal-like domain-containing protein [Balneolaceae bacterium ANBcel3]
MSSFSITYLLTLCPGESAEDKILALQLEQSAELPDQVVHKAGVEYVKGTVKENVRINDWLFIVSIEWPSENIGKDPVQFLNLLFGNISMKTGICVLDISWSRVLSDVFSGPAFGIDGLRKKWGIEHRALSCTALKPMGSHPSTLAALAYQFALGGIDIIKDDHGLADQPAAPFQKRVTACLEALDRAAQKTGRRARYFPNISAEPAIARQRYEWAAEIGADGVLVAPMLTGPGLIHELSQMEQKLPLMAHPSFSGLYAVHHPILQEILKLRSSSAYTDISNIPTEQRSEYARLLHGIEPGLFYGGLFRALGADFVIYPNSKGRFSFPEESCRSINSWCRTSRMPYPASFPTPGGGLDASEMKQWLELYGKDTTFLIGGSLYSHPDGVFQASKSFSDSILPS